MLLLIGLSIYVFKTNTNKPTKSQSITETLEKKEVKLEIPENKQEDTKEEDNIIEEEDQPSPDPLKNLFVDVLKESVDFLFKKDVHVVAIGDSLTQGVGDTSGEGGYVGILEKTVNLEENDTVFSNFGKRGNRTDQLLKRLNDNKITSAINDADIIIITIGANDIMKVVKHNFTKLTYKKFASEQVLFEERLTEIFDKLNELNPKAEIYLLGFYNPFDKYFHEIKELDLIIDNWNDTSQAVTESYENGTFIPIKDLFDDTTINLFADDRFHPNRVGYYRMAERVLDYLTEEER